jgi:Uma2 family endonuclease
MGPKGESMVATEPRAKTGWQTLPERRIVLYDVSWETYERLLVDQTDKVVPHLNYDEGVLEIVGPSLEHEHANRALAQIVMLVSLEWAINVIDIGSTTHKRQKLRKGFEADSSFYIANAGRMRGTKELDLAVDPPADLVIEIDIASYSLNKLPIYAALGVPEVWRYIGGRIEISVLEGDRYVQVTESRALPPVTDAVLAQFVSEAQSRTSSDWARLVQNWARSQRMGTDEVAQVET